MKIIFLDIDGVLTTEQSYASATMIDGYLFVPFRPDPVENLNKLVKDTGAKVVMSSSWRYGKSVKDLRALLLNEEVECDLIDKTPEIHKDACRGQEIQCWFMENKDLNIESFVILDDNCSMDITQRYSNRFVDTSGIIGLTEDDVEKAKEILSRKLS